MQEEEISDTPTECESEIDATINPDEMLPLLKGKKKVMIITGAGISAASNIPTFRGEKGMWK
jgi:hypothetical protein